VIVKGYSEPLVEEVVVEEVVEGEELVDIPGAIAPH
jgi:hypothetical protein